MNFKKVMPLLMLLIFVGSVGSNVFAATGDVDTLCKEMVDDLSIAGGCVDEDGIIEGIFSTSTLLILGIGTLAILIVLAFVASKFFGVQAKKRAV